MRVSEHFHLDRTQPELDFVDVDIYGDVLAFVDPRALRLLRTDWGQECVFLVQDFFSTVLRAIQENRSDDARQMLAAIREPNETHLGYSSGVARGRALGTQSAAHVGAALARSEAAKSGLLEDLEDTILMVEGVSIDLISDITTCLIRRQLVDYTQSVAREYGLSLTPGVPSGPLWDPLRHEWNDSEFHPLPITPSGRLLLLPKAIVRRKLEYSQEEYYRDYIVEYLRESEIAANGELVQLLKDGTPRVTRKSIEMKYGAGKATIVATTLKEPALLDRYRKAKVGRPSSALLHADFAELTGTEEPDWDQLLSSVSAVTPGQEGATAYHNVVERLLTPLLYPSLVWPKMEFPIHDSRKRIDITYENASTSGFFKWVGQHYVAPLVFVECKNYSGDPGNPELDQLGGRFSPRRGQVGLLLCRGFADKALFVDRCRDTAADGRGYIVPLDDEDLHHLVEDVRAAHGNSEYRLLAERFQTLVQ